MAQKQSSKGGQRSVSGDGTITGKFTKEEAEILERAIDQFISNNYECPRDVALNLMVMKRGNMPSIMTQIGKQVLPERASRSIYAYVRRHVMSHTTGRWSDEEFLVLLKHYFANANDPSLSWAPVSKSINRSPEQVHEKYREIRPKIDTYRPLITNPDLTDEEKVLELARMRLSGVSGPKYMDDKIFKDPEMQQELYDTIRELMQERRGPAKLEKIPWSKVQKRFPTKSSTKLRIHFNMTLLPKVYREVFPGFSSRMVSRLSIRWIRKLLKRPGWSNIKSLNDIEFGKKFPQLPVIYIRHCTRRALSKTLRKFKALLLSPHRLLLDPELSLLAMDDISVLKKNSFKHLFDSENMFKVIKFAYKEMEIKKWKKHDKHILRQIKKDLLPSCKL